MAGEAPGPDQAGAAGVRPAGSPLGWSASRWGPTRGKGWAGEAGAQKERSQGEERRGRVEKKSVSVHMSRQSSQRERSTGRRERVGKGGSEESDFFFF